jgi:hypothetical protein
MASTSDLFSQALAQFQRGGAAPSTLSALEGYDPSQALNTYAQGAYNTFNQGFKQNLSDLKGSAVGAGRLKTGFYDQDVGRLATTMGNQEQQAIAGQALNAASLKASTLGTATGYQEDEQNRYLDLLSGQLDREQAQRNANAQQTAGIFGGLGELGGAAAGIALLSDERYKDDVEPIEGASDKVRRMPGYRFSYKGDDEPQVGVMAQDVQREVPEAVEGGGREPMMVDYRKLVPMLIEASREQGDEIDRLKVALRHGQPMAQRSPAMAEVM